MINQLFELGEILFTRGIREHFNNSDKPKELLTRHVTGDFGDLDQEDINENLYAIEKGDQRIFSAYNYESKKIYIITEWDRNHTIVMFEEEY